MDRIPECFGYPLSIDANSKIKNLVLDSGLKTVNLLWIFPENFSFIFGYIQGLKNHYYFWISSVIHRGVMSDKYLLKILTKKHTGGYN